jgi:periplasmic protein TonB
MIAKDQMDNFDNIVFQNKNKSYGAYALRKRYKKNVTIGLLISVVCFMSVAVYAYIWSLSLSNEMADSEYQQMVADYEAYAMLKNVDSLMPKALPKKEIVKAKDDNFKVVDTLKPEIDTLRVLKLSDIPKDSLNNDSLAAGDSSHAGSANGSGNGNLWVKVGTLPTPPCGFAGIKKFQALYTQYPDEAKKKKIQGDVEVEIFVRKDGSIDKVSISKSVDPFLDKEALRVTNAFIKAYPKWTPGKRNSTPVDFLTYLKFKFRLY